MSANSENHGGGGVIVPVVLAGIVMILGALWNVMVTSWYFYAHWLQPVLMAGCLVLLPAVNKWFICRIVARKKVGNWMASKQESFRVWWRTWQVWLIQLWVLLAVLGWNYLMSDHVKSIAYRPLPLVFQGMLHWGPETVKEWYEHPGGWPMVWILIPTVASAVMIQKVAGMFFVMRVRRINDCLEGKDVETQELEIVDRELDCTYMKFGSSRKGGHVAIYHEWVAKNVAIMLRDQTAVRRGYELVRQEAEKELVALRKSLGLYNGAQKVFRANLVTLRKGTSLALLSSLEDAGRILASPGLVELVDTQQWGEFNTLMEEFVAELGRIEAMALEWAAAGAKADARLTRESAVELLGLPVAFTANQISERRKQFARIYHPDQASDPDQCERNTKRFQGINDACDFLMNARRLNER